MRKIIGLLVAALALIALVAGFTWAYFSDSETSAGNTLVAGTLDLGLSNTDEMATGSTTGTWTSSDWKPGDTRAGTLYVSNSGSIDIGTLTVAFTYDSVDTSGRPASISGSPWNADPYDYFDKMVKATTATWKGSSVQAIQGKTLAELKAAGPITLPGGLAAGSKEALYVEFQFLPEATNGCQGNKVDVTVTVTGTQQ